MSVLVACRDSGVVGGGGLCGCPLRKAVAQLGRTRRFEAWSQEPFGEGTHTGRTARSEIKSGDKGAVAGSDGRTKVGCHPIAPHGTGVANPSDPGPSLRHLCAA